MPTYAVSVVVPCRNYGKYLDSAIESVLQQTAFGDSVEVLVINDHSTDSLTIEKLVYWQSADARVRVLHNDGPLGAATARNLGIAAASREWIAFLDADDVWLPGSLEVRWKTATSCPQSEWIGADFRRLHDDGTCDTEGFFKSRSASHQGLRDAYGSDTVLRLARPVREFLQMSLGWTSTVMVKKSLLLRVGGFEATLGNYEDHHLWLRLARETDFYFVPKAVTLYRQHAESVSRREIPPAYWYIVAIRMLWRNPDFRIYRPLMREKLAFLFEQNMYYHRGRGETKLAVKAAAHALLQKPSCKKQWKNLASILVGRS